MIDMVNIMSRLSDQRPVFHSEADFQHTLAWQLHEVFPDAQIRLERRPLPGERLYLDIWMATEEGIVAIELKYPTRGLSVDVKGESYRLTNQNAWPVSGYDFVNDLRRLESVISQLADTVGLAILLTNDNSHWNDHRSDSIGAAFRIYEGRILSGTLSWGPNPNLNSIKGRVQPLSLQGAYAMHWRSIPCSIVK